jgi:hypothetical protein
LGSTALFKFKPSEGIMLKRSSVSINLLVIVFLVLLTIFLILSISKYSSIGKNLGENNLQSCVIYIVKDDVNDPSLRSYQQKIVEYYQKRIENIKCEATITSQAQKGALNLFVVFKNNHFNIVNEVGSPSIVVYPMGFISPDETVISIPDELKTFLQLDPNQKITPFSEVKIRETTIPVIGKALNINFYPSFKGTIIARSDLATPIIFTDGRNLYFNFYIKQDNPDFDNVIENLILQFYTENYQS